MNDQKINLKFPGMRKSQDFVIYPENTTHQGLVVQSSTRIAIVGPYKTTLSKNRSNGAYFPHLDKDAGAIDIETPKGMFELIRDFKVGK